MLTAGTGRVERGGGEGVWDQGQRRRRGVTFFGEEDRIAHTFFPSPSSSAPAAYSSNGWLHWVLVITSLLSDFLAFLALVAVSPCICR